MKKPLFYFVLFFFSIPLIYAESIETTAIENLETYSLEELAPDYECTYTVSFTVSIGSGLFGGEIDVECEGTGTSNESGQEACERAAEVVASCIRVWEHFF